MTRHMLLLGGARGVHPKARGLGLKLSLMMRMSRLLAQKDLDTYDRIYGMPADASLEEWVDCARLIHRHDPIDVIGGFNEVAQGQAAEIARALDLPFHTPEVIRYTQQKDEMRRVLREAGLDTTPARLVCCAAEIEAFAAAHGYPIVLKPVDARGSLGVSIVRSSQDLAAALTWIGTWAPKSRMLVEKFLEGDEFSVEGFSERGRHRIVCVTQKFKDPVTSVETGHCLPAPLPEATRAAVACFVTDVLTALGIEDGPSHTEVIVTAEGPRIVETHVRLGGDSIPELIELVSGVDLEELWIRQTLGESVFDRLPSRLDRFASVSFVSPRAVGKLERIEGIEGAASMCGIARVETLQEPGTEVQGAYDSFSRGAYAIAAGDTAAEAVSRAREATGRLRFVVSCAG